MRTITTAAIGFACLAVVACGGSTASPGATCGAGTMLVNGQCLVDGNGGASVGTDGGASGSGGGGGDSLAGGGGIAVDAGGGASAMGPCIGKSVVANGSPGLIDDFENGDVAILTNDGRFGRWGTVTGCTVTPTPLLPAAPVAGKTVNNESKYALHIAVTGCTTGFAVGASINIVSGLRCAYDVSQYDGIYFWAIGAGVRLGMHIGMRTTTPESFGGDGTCANDAGDTGCWDEYGAASILTEDWKEYSFTWSQLHQGGWGTKATWDPKQVSGVSFLVSEDQVVKATVDFSLDNVGFFKGTAPTDPPMPGQ